MSSPVAASQRLGYSVQPRYAIVGEATAYEGYSQDVAEYYASIPLETTAVAINDPLFRAAAASIYMNLSLFALDRNIDISDRLPDPSSMQFYNRGQFMRVMEDVGAAPGGLAQPVERGRWTPLGGHMTILANSRRNNALTFSIAGHESIHAGGYSELDTKIVIDEHAQPTIVAGPSRMGYRDNASGDHDWITEIMTEVSNLDIRRNHWVNDRFLRDYLPTHPARPEGYRAGVLLLDGIMRHSFEAPRAREVITELETGLLDGDMRRLQPLTDAVGPLIMHKLTRLSTVKRGANKALAKQLGMSEVVHKINSHDYSNVLTML